MQKLIYIGLCILALGAGRCLGQTGIHLPQPDLSFSFQTFTPLSVPPGAHEENSPLRPDLNLIRPLLYGRIPGAILTSAGWNWRLRRNFPLACG